MKYWLLFLSLFFLGAAPVRAEQFYEQGHFKHIPIKSKQQLTIVVAPNPVDCHGAHGLQKCLSITSDDGKKDTLYEGIHGYTHKNGQAATLLVERVEYDFTADVPIPQDISSIHYYLISTK